MKTYRSCLLIDDNPLDNYINTKIISRSNVATEILAIESPEEALELLRAGKFRPEIIFLDIRMPVMDGFDFLDEYEKLDIDKDHIEIVMLTSSINPGDMERAKHYKHVRKYITKTLTPDILLQLAS